MAGPGPGQLVWQLEKRVGGAGDNIACDVDDSPAPAARSIPELLECLARLNPVPFRQHSDGLLYPDPGQQRMLQLAHGGAQPARLAGRCCLSGWRLGLPCLRHARLGGQQVGKDHRAGEVGQIITADPPAILGPADDRIVRYDKSRSLGLALSFVRVSRRRCARGHDTAVWLGRCPPRGLAALSRVRACGISLAATGASPALRLTTDSIHPASQRKISPDACLGFAGTLARHRAPASSPRRCITAFADGLVMALPSGNTTVGTVWLPPLTDIT
jgi:hypothetical protein